MIWGVIICLSIGIGLIFSELRPTSLELKEEGPGLFLWGPLCLAASLVFSVLGLWENGWASTVYWIFTVLTGVLLIMSLTVGWVYGKSVPPAAIIIFGIPLLPIIFLYNSYMFFLNKDSSNLKSAVVKGVVLDIAVIAVIAGVIWFFYIYLPGK